MKKQHLYILLIIFVFSCKNEVIKNQKKISGTWQIDKINSESNLPLVEKREIRLGICEQSPLCSMSIETQKGSFTPTTWLIDENKTLMINDLGEIRDKFDFLMFSRWNYKLDENMLFLDGGYLATKDKNGVFIKCENCQVVLKRQK